MDKKDNKLKMALHGISIWKIIVFFFILVILIMSLVVKYSSKIQLPDIIKKAGDPTATISALLEIVFTLSMVINLNYNNNKTINNLNNSVFINPTFVNGDHYGYKSPSLEDEQRASLTRYLTNVASIENSIGELKNLRDKHFDNELIKKKKDVSREIKHFEELLAPITRSEDKSEYVSECCNIFNSYINDVYRLLGTIYDDSIQAHVAKMQNPQEFYKQFDEVYKEVEKIQIKLPPYKQN